MWGILGSLLSGGMTGLLGSFIQRLFDFKTKKLELDIEAQKLVNEIALRRVDAEVMAQEWAARTKVAEVEEAGKEAVADSQAFAVSLTSETPVFSGRLTSITATQGWFLIILDFIRGMVRPVLTLYLCGITTMIYLQAKNLMGTAVFPFQAYDLLDKIVQTVLYLTTTCVLFWFGSRSKQQPPKL